MKCERAMAACARSGEREFRDATRYGERKHTGKYEGDEGHDEGRDPHEEDGRDRDVDGRPTAKLFDDVEAVSLDDVIWMQELRSCK